MYALAGCILFTGAVIQGSAGLGMNLLAAPLLALVDPALVPIPLLFAALIFSFLAVRREIHHVDWHGAGLAIAARIPGTVLGVLAVTLLPVREFSMAVGVFVLICVLLSVISWSPRPTTPALLTAGFVGGVLGTSASIAGPPIAILYQHRTGPQIRATLAAYFAFGTGVSLTGLAIAGQITETKLVASLILLPFMLAGFVLSGRLRRFLDGGWMRISVLAVSTASAILLLARGLLG